MTSAQVVETSVTNNSSFQNYTHPDDHTIRTTDTPGFKPFSTPEPFSFAHDAVSHVIKDKGSGVENGFKPFTIFSVVCARLSVSVKILELFLLEETVNAIVLVF